MLELPLSRHIDRILVRFIVGHAATVRTHGHEVVPHLLQEIVEPDVQPAVISLRVSPFCGTAVPLYRRLVPLLIHVGQRRLVDVKQRADLAVVHTLVLLLLVLVQFHVVLPADDPFRVVAVYILVPVIEQERHALFMLAYRRTLRFGVAEKREQVRLAPVPVRVQRHEQRIERADRHPFRVEAGITLTRRVEPVPAHIRGFTQSSGEQGSLFLPGSLFHLRFLFHIVISFR